MYIFREYLNPVFFFYSSGTNGVRTAWREPTHVTDLGTEYCLINRDIRTRHNDNDDAPVFFFSSFHNNICIRWTTVVWGALMRREVYRISVQSMWPVVVHLMGIYRPLKFKAARDSRGRQGRETKMSKKYQMSGKKWCNLSTSMIRRKTRVEKSAEHDFCSELSVYRRIVEIDLWISWTP